MPLIAVIALVVASWLLGAYFEFRMWRQIGRFIRSRIGGTARRIG